MRPVQILSLSGENLLSEITLIGGNDSGIFVSSVQSGTDADLAGVKVGYHLLMVRLDNLLVFATKTPTVIVEVELTFFWIHLSSSWREMFMEKQRVCL